jgi:hypothetical protein
MAKELEQWLLAILDFRLSPCFECCMFSFVMFSGVWSLVANVSEHSVCSIFIGEWVSYNICNVKI